MICSVRSLGLTALSLGKARRLIRTFQPDVIVGTGGYASFPLLKEANCRSPMGSQRMVLPAHPRCGFVLR